MATLFLGGKFSLQDVEMAAVSLQAYAVGLPGLIGIKTLVPSFFARQDMKTPVKVAVAALACKFVVTLPLLWYWVAQGLHAPHAVLAGGTALGATINAAVLWLLFRRQEPRGQAGSDVQAAAQDRRRGGPVVHAADRIRPGARALA